MSDDCVIHYLSAVWALREHGQPTQGVGTCDDADPDEHRDHGGES